ncbi:helix-turn-helix domain-containing protein [Stenotrophomonas acidaminiphila]|uniref:helix-turn-helix domain-containing protein n=1 Tax=Stenotrophomonas acidaminiphila TaxID=128780 RepID=UPI00137543D2|nr:helix-turn-helix domain-containing protein [Stenotrophomonas acidaminiphila]NCT87007.1 helix-turn-helix domain-containing protein [Stenotrophomonas acidaminiphila]
MSERMLDLLIRQWPGKTHLSAEETAKVLMQHPYTVRERMRNGELPGAVKRDGTWKMPLPDLAEHLEPTPKAPQIPSPPVIVGGARRRKAVVMNFRRDRFWAQVARALGDFETADALDGRAQAEYDEQVRLFQMERAERRRAGLMAIAVQAHPLEPGDDEPSGL